MTIKLHKKNYMSRDEVSYSVVDFYPNSDYKNALDKLLFQSSALKTLIKEAQ